MKGQSDVTNTIYLIEDAAWSVTVTVKPEEGYDDSFDEVVIPLELSDGQTPANCKAEETFEPKIVAVACSEESSKPELSITVDNSSSTLEGIFEIIEFIVNGMTVT